VVDAACSRANSASTHSWPSDRYAPLGPRRGGDREAHRGFSAGLPASPRPPVADEQPEPARLEVSESSTSLTGESRSGATDADASVLANDPTFTICIRALDELGFGGLATLDGPQP
jgi:hypothetical protein